MMRRKQSISFLLLMIAFCYLNAQDTINPLKGDIRVHDPGMIKEGYIYYVFHTGKGIPVKTSKDKIYWKIAGRVFDTTALPAWHKYAASPLFNGGAIAGASEEQKKVAKTIPVSNSGFRNKGNAFDDTKPRMVIILNL